MLDSLRRQSTFFEYAITALSVIVIFIASLMITHIYPFGVNMWPGLQPDALAVFSWFSQTLKGEASIAYSFSYSLGGGMYPIFLQYLANPVNLLLVFFSVDTIPAFISLSYGIHVTLASLAMLLFLRRRYEIPRVFRMLLALAYPFTWSSLAFSSYVQYLPALVLLPLLAFGFFELIEKKSPLVFVLSLVGLLISSLYSLWIISLTFVFLLAASSLFKTSRSYITKEKCLLVLKSFGIALLIASFVYIPFLFSRGNQLISLLGNSREVIAVYTLTPYELFRSFCWGSASASFPFVQFPVSGLVFVLMVSYLLFTGKQEGIKRFCFVLVFCLCSLSMLWNPSALLWTGFSAHNIGWLAYTFPLSFVAIAFSARFIYLAGNYSDQRKMYIPISSAGLIIFMYLFMYLFDPCEDSLSFAIQMISILLISGITAFLLIAEDAREQIANLIKIIAGILFGICLCEQIFFFSMYAGVHIKDANAVVPVYQQRISEIDTVIKSADSEEVPRRSEVLDYKFNSGVNLTEPSLSNLIFGIRGLSRSEVAFETSASTTLLNKLGYGRPKGNAYAVSYNSPLYMTDRFFGLSTIYAQKQPYGYDEYATYALGGAVKNITAYKLQAQARLAWAMPKNTESITWQTNPFINQELWFGQLLGQKPNLYKRVEIKPANFPTMLSPDIVENLEFVGNPQRLDQHSCTITAVEDAPLYLEFEGNTPAGLIVDGKFIQTMNCGFYDKNVIYLGEKKKGQIVRIQARTLFEQDALESMSAAYLDTQAAQDCFKQLEKHAMHVMTWKENSFEGKVDLTNQQDVIMTIPYDRNWNIYIDGIKCSYSEYEGLIKIPGKEGTHVISGQYHIKYWTVGLILSLVGLRLLSVFSQKRKNK